MNATITYKPDGSKVFVVNGDAVTQQEYERAMPSRLNDMFAARRGPALMTDVTLFEGQGTLDKQFGGNEKDMQRVLDIAKKHGYTPNRNDVYMPGLARYPGDPLAFVPPTGGRGHIKNVLSAQGRGCDGAVTVEARQDEPEPDVPLAYDLIEEARTKMVAMRPEIGERDQNEVRQEILDTHGYGKGDIHKIKKPKVVKPRKRKK